MYPNLKIELWRQGIRQNRFARMLGIDETLLSRIVNGFREPDAQTRARIAELLGTDERWLFERSDIGNTGAQTAASRPHYSSARQWNDTVIKHSERE